MTDVHGEVIDVGGDHDLGQSRVLRLGPWMTLGLAVLVGALLGAAAMHMWDGRQARSDDWMTTADLQVSLGAGSSERVCTRATGEAMVPVSTAVVNRSGGPLTLIAISVSGPGARYVDSPPGGPSTGLPRRLPPGQVIDVRFGLASDLRVPVRPLPSVRFTVTDGHGQPRSLPIVIPDLDSIWGMTLLPDNC